MMHKHILLAVDPDIKNAKAINEVQKLVGTESIVTILHVMGEQDVQASVRLGTHVNELKKIRSEKLQDTKDLLEAANIQYEEIIERGNPKEKIVDYANNGNYDIVVVSNHKAQENKKVVLGSVSHKIAKRAHIPVLIVK